MHTWQYVAFMKKIECSICHKAFSRIDMHLVSHDISQEEYSKKFPEDKFSISYLKRQKKIKEKGLPKIHGNKGRVAWNRGKKTSDSAKKKISESHWARRPLSETVEIRKKMSLNGQRTFKKLHEEGKAFRMPKGYHTEEHKQKIKKLMTGRVVTWNEKIKENHWTKKSDEEIQKIINKIQHCGTKTNAKRGWFFSHKMNCSFHFMSSYEEERMKFFEESPEVICFTNQHKIWIKYEWNGGVHKYNPDFLVTFKDGTTRIEEIKGSILEKDKIRTDLKEAACIEYSKKNGYDYKMIFKKDLRKI